MGQSDLAAFAQLTRGTISTKLAAKTGLYRTITPTGGVLQSGSVLPLTPQRIAHALADNVPPFWEGKACVQELRASDYNWRQMEWIGWWFQFRALKILRSMGASVGPTFGSVAFDCMLSGVWDFKAHPQKDSGANYAYLNDEAAVNECLLSCGHIGWLVAVGSAVYDTDGKFKQWHDQLKGSVSAYVRQGQSLGRQSRVRKAAFHLEEIVWIEFRSATDLNRALAAHILRRGLQARQRNSDGSARNPKYGFSYRRWHDYVTAGGGLIRTGSVRVL